MSLPDWDIGPSVSYPLHPRRALCPHHQRLPLYDFLHPAQFEPKNLTEQQILPSPTPPIRPSIHLFLTPFKTPSKELAQSHTLHTTELLQDWYQWLSILSSLATASGSSWITSLRVARATEESWQSLLFATSSALGAMEHPLEPHLISSGGQQASYRVQRMSGAYEDSTNALAREFETDLGSLRVVLRLIWVFHEVIVWCR